MKPPAFAHVARFLLALSALLPVRFAAAQVSVTPDGTSTPNRDIHTSHKATFTVFNNAGFGSVNSFKCSAASVVVCDSVKGPASIAPGNNAPVDVYYSVTNAGSGTITLRASGIPGTDDGYFVVPVVLPAGAPRISTLPYLADKQDLSRCAASCFAATTAHSTVPYVSLDKPRNVTLVYRGDRVQPRPFVLVDVAPDSAFGTFPTEYTLQVKIAGVHAKFVNGDSTLRFTNPGSVTYRIGGQIDTITTNALADSVVYPMDILVTSKIGVSTFTNRWVTQYLSINEKNSPIARGWTLAGIQRAYLQSDSSLLVKEGDGSAVYFKKRTTFGTTSWTTPVGDFSVVTKSGTTFVRAYPDSTKVTFSNGLMVKAADRWGARDTVIYDGSKRVTQIKDPVDKATALAYDANGIRTITDPSGRVTTDSVAPNKTLVWVKDPDGVKTSFGYDSPWLRLLTITARNNQTTTLAYDASSGTLSTETGPQILVSTGLPGNPLATLAPWQKVGVPYTTTSVTAFVPALPDTAYARVVEPSGALTRFSVNRWGSPRRTIQPMASGQRDTTTISYTVDGLPATVVKPGYGAGVRDTLGYNASGLLVYSKPAADTITAISYGAYAQPATVAVRGRDSTTNFLGALGRVDSVRVGSTTVAKIPAYDTFGRPTSIRRPNADTTVFTYYGMGTHRNLNTSTLSGSRTTTYRYDAVGRTVAAAPPISSGLPTDSTEYGSMNQITARRQRLSSGTTISTTFQADVMLRDTTVTDPKGQKYRFLYNELGWLIRQKDPAGARDTMQYSIGGDLVKATSRRNLDVTFVYDSLHRVTSRLATDTATYSYPSHGLQLTGVNKRGSFSVADTVNFNVLGQATSAITRLAGQRFARTYHYAPSRQLDSVYISGPGGTSFTTRGYGYDASRGVLTGVKLGTALTSFTRDAGLQDSARTFPGSGGTVQRLFGSLRAPVKLYSSAAYGSTIERWLGFDPVGRITEQLKVSGLNGRFFVYDSLGRFQRASDSTVSAGTLPPGCPDFVNGSLLCNNSVTWSYVAGTQRVDTFDVVGNRTSLNGTYTAGTNRITGFNGCTYVTNGAGSDSVRTCGGTVTTFTWDKADALTGLNVGGTAVTMDYDAFGRLVRRTAGGVDGHFLWDGDHLLAELGTGAGTVTAEYSYYPGMDRLHAMIVGAAAYYAHEDGLGNVIVLSDTSAAMKRTFTYDDWGQILTSTDPSAVFGNKDRARWKGALWMGPETEIVYMRNRWYEPRTGRFVSEDPIGLEGGINPTVFAVANPINGLDPSGLQSCGWLYSDTSISGGGMNTSTGGGEWTWTCPSGGARHSSWGGSIFLGGLGPATGGVPGSPGRETAVDRFLGERVSCGQAAFNLGLAVVLEGTGMKYGLKAAKAAGRMSRYAESTARDWVSSRARRRAISSARSEMVTSAAAVTLWSTSDNMIDFAMTAGGGLQGLRSFLDYAPGAGIAFGVADWLRCQ